MQTQLAVHKRLLQLRAQARSALGVSVHARLVEAHGVAPVLLGSVQGQVSQAQQGLGIGAIVREQAHPHTGRGAKQLAGQLQRLPQACQQLIGERHRVVRRQQGGHQHQKLVAAQARGHRPSLQRRTQALGHRAQQAVAGLVAQRVVEFLEVVQVHEHHRKTPLACACGVHALSQAVKDGGSVGQAGEPIVLRAVLGAVSLGTCIGHVDEGQQHVVALGVGAGFDAHHPRVARVALPAHLTHGHAVGRRERRQGGQETLTCCVVQLIQQAPAHRSAAPVHTQKAPRLLVGPTHHQPPVHGEQAHRRIVEQVSRGPAHTAAVHPRLGCGLDQVPPLVLKATVFADGGPGPRRAMKAL